MNRMRNTFNAEIIFNLEIYLSKRLLRIPIQVLQRKWPNKKVKDLQKKKIFEFES